MALTYFITPSKLKELSFINENVEDSVLKPVIQRVQRLYIEPLLGTPLYNKLTTLIIAGTVPSPYDTLLEDYVRPCLLAWCEYKAAPHINNELRNKAVGKSSDADITASSEAELNYIRADFKADAESYEQKLIGHLCDSIENDTYPEYTEYDAANKEEVAPKKKTYGRTSFLA